MKIEINSSEQLLAESVWSTGAVRDAARESLALIQAGESPHFQFVPGALPQLAKTLIEFANQEFGGIPHTPEHTQWININVGGVHRVNELCSSMEMSGLGPRQRASALVDLLLVNETLDSGGLSSWTYYDRPTDQSLTRTEALGVATLRAFADGLFSEHGGLDPFRVDCKRLAQISASEFAKAFQITDSNQIDGGVEARISRLRTLSTVLQNSSIVRPAALIDRLDVAATGSGIMTERLLLKEVLTLFSPLWPGELAVGSQAAGDVWKIDGNRVIPVHRMAQWLCYSLRPVLSAGGQTFDVTRHLTPLAGYRNAGCLVDGQVLLAKNSAATERSYAMSDPFVVEWRSATVAALELLAHEMREQTGLGEELLNFERLHGLAWRVGRKLAAAARPGAQPPFQVVVRDTPF